MNVTCRNVFIALMPLVCWTHLSCGQRLKGHGLTILNGNLTEPDEDWGLRVNGSTYVTEPHLMRNHAPAYGAVQVKSGDLITVHLTLENRYKVRHVVFKAEAGSSPALHPEGMLPIEAMPLIPGGFEILAVDGLQQPLADGCARKVVIRIRVHSDKQQMLYLNFSSLDDPAKDDLSRDYVLLFINNPADLAAHEYSMGRSKSPLVLPKK